MANKHRAELTNSTIERILQWVGCDGRADKKQLMHILEMYESELKKLIVYDIVESDFNSLRLCPHCNKVYTEDSCSCKTALN